MQRQRTGIFRFFWIPGKHGGYGRRNFTEKDRKKNMPDTKAPGMMEILTVQQGRVSYFVFTWLLNFGPK